MGKDRLAAFSDGVIAILITIWCWSCGYRTVPIWRPSWAWRRIACLSQTDNDDGA
jgi:hypothetical protein